MPGCALCELCWQKEYTGTFNALNDATPFLLERGRALAKDFPGYFADRCIHLPDFLTAVNGELTAFLLRRQYRRQLEETRRDARGQYAQLSELLTATAAGLGRSVPQQGRRISAALVRPCGPRKGGDGLRGYGGLLPHGGGLLCLLLADGMAAARGSPAGVRLTCRLLEQFCRRASRAGGGHEDPEHSHLVGARRPEASPPLISSPADRRRGEAAFKYGAAPSYVKKGALSGGSPAGPCRRVCGAGGGSG